MTASLNVLDASRRSRQLVPLLRVLQALGGALGRCVPAPSAAEADGSAAWNVRPPAPLEAMFASLATLAALDGVVDSDDESVAPDDAAEAARSGNAGADGTADDGAAAPAPPPPLATMVARIAERAAQYCGSADVAVAVAALSAFGDAAVGLRARGGVLRPLLHRVWPQLLGALAPRAPRPAFSAAVALLARLVCECGTAGFLSSRFRESVWPAFRGALRAGCPWRDAPSLVVAPEEQGAGVRQQHQQQVMTQAATAQAAVLRAVRKMVGCPALALAGLSWEVCMATLPFCDARAPPELQSAAVALLQALARRDGDAVWLFVSSPAARASSGGGLGADAAQQAMLQVERWMDVEGL